MANRNTQIIEKWRALLAVTPAGESPKRRVLLVATDIGLTLMVLVVIAVLAGTLIRHGDDVVLGAASQHRVYSDSHATEHPRQTIWPSASETAFDHARKHMQAGYHCPQHPEVISEFPGACPICGERLIWSSGAGAAPEVLEKSATMVGQRHLKRVPLFGSGWVEHLNVNKVGAQVAKGALLMELYMPEFGDGVDRQTGVVRLYAPVTGRVQAIHVAENKFVASGAVVMEIEDSSSLWLKSTLSRAESARVHSGQPVEVMLATTPATVLRGEVDTVVTEHDGQDEATVWFRFDDNPLLHTLPQIDVRIYIRA